MRLAVAALAALVAVACSSGSAEKVDRSDETDLPFIADAWDRGYTICEVFGLAEIARQQRVPADVPSVARAVPELNRPPFDAAAEAGCTAALLGQPNANPHRQAGEPPP